MSSNVVRMYFPSIRRLSPFRIVLLPSFLISSVEPCPQLPAFCAGTDRIACADVFSHQMEEESPMIPDLFCIEQKSSGRTFAHECSSQIRVFNNKCEDRVRAVYGFSADQDRKS